jgi:hypothetical protein
MSFPIVIFVFFANKKFDVVYEAGQDFLLLAIILN